MNEKMIDGKIDLDSEIGKELGFTSNKFNRGSYLWKQGDYVYISFIHSKEEGKGYLHDLFRAIQRAGLGIKVPTPFAKMELICKSHNFKKTSEWFEAVESNCEVWVKKGNGERLKELNQTKKRDRLAKKRYGKTYEEIPNRSKGIINDLIDLEKREKE